MTLNEAIEELERADDEYWEKRKAYYKAEEEMAVARKRFNVADAAVTRMQRMELGV